MTMDKVESVSWKTLAEEKEKEWKSILESRIEALEKQCKEKDNELVSIKEKFTELKENFKYNLKLLEERDKELEKYDVSVVEHRTAVNSKNAEISELKIHLDDLKNVIKREEKIREELQANYQKRLREKQAQVDAYKCSKDGEIQDERKDYEEFRRNLQLQLLNVQNQLDTQKSELTMEFETALKKREHEFRLQFDELNGKAIEHELKAKILEKELELVRECNEKTVAAAEESETAQIQLEKLIKQKEWELVNNTALKDSQIAECQNKLAACESAMKKMQEDFQRKYSEMDKLARDKENALERTKNGYLEKEQSMQVIIQDLQSKLEDGLIRERQLTWSNQDLTKEKEMQIEKLQEELNDVKEKWNRHIADTSRDNVTRDLEYNNAFEEQRRLKQELAQRKEDLERYRKELKAASEREEKLDKARTQTNLDWQRRCEQLQNQQYESSEELIQRLTSARNEAQALIKERDREVHHKMLLVKSLYRERDQLRALLKNHNISLDSFVSLSPEASTDKEEELNYVEDLQKQNTGLKELIAQMRQQMESLGSDSQKVQSKSSVENHFINEDETQELRKENKELKEKLKTLRRTEKDKSHQPTTKDSEEVLSQVESNSIIKNHIVALNSALGTLRSEKVELAAVVKKQQARIAYLESSLEEISKQPRQKQIQIDQLSYELNSCKQRHETEVIGLKNRLGQLEFLLSEARREADEYHRASLERNDELVALGNQLSALKMEMTELNPSINFGAQELYIQQLQDELNQLRKRTSAINASDVDSIGINISDGSSSADLKQKLRTAAARIIHLAKENQQLIESNNRLRAELKAQMNTVIENKLLVRPNPGVYFEDNKSFDKIKTESEQMRSKAAQDRLEQLEKLQYQLTKKELQFAQKFKYGSRADNFEKPSHKYFEYSGAPERDIGEAFTKHINDSQSAEMLEKSHDTDQQMLASFSSAGGDSIQKVWQMLEASNLSGGPSTPRSLHGSYPTKNKSSVEKLDTQHMRNDGGDNFFLEGQPVPTEVRPYKEHGQQKSRPKSIERQKIFKPRLKVRNYNVKDDSSRR